MFDDTNILNIFFRLGLVILISGVMLGIVMGEWTVLILLGALFTFSPLINKAVRNRKEIYS